MNKTGVAAAPCVAAVMLASLAAQAQQPAMPVIGLLQIGPASAAAQNVRYWHKADTPVAITNVRFWG
jgi:hypothetical protein